MRNNFKSRFPAFNIIHRNEAVVTDTIFSDTPVIDSGVTMAQSFASKDSLISDLYPIDSSKQYVNTLEDNIQFRGAMSKLISDYVQVEIFNKVKDIFRMYHKTCWHSEPYHQNQILLNRIIGPLKHGLHHPQQDWCTCQLLAALHELCVVLTQSLVLSISERANGVTPDISILLIYTFYQSVYYASHNQSFPSTSKEKDAFWVGLCEYVGAAITHKLLDSSSNKIIYRSAVHLYQLGDCIWD